MTFHTYTPIPQPISLLKINILPLTVSEMQPGYAFTSSPSKAYRDTMDESKTRTALKGCGVTLGQCEIDNGNLKRFSCFHFLYNFCESAKLPLGSP